MERSLTQKDIERWAGVRNFSRGWAYYQERRIKSVQVFVSDEGDVWWAEAVVAGTFDNYDVFVE